MKSKDHCKKISEALKEKWKSPQYRKNQKNSMRKSKYDYLTKEMLYEDYFENKMPYSAIAKKYGISTSIVQFLMKKRGFKARTHSEIISGEKHPFFGKHHSEETKAKISKTNKIKGLHPPWQLSPLLNGKKLEEVIGIEKTKISREKTRQFNIGRKRSPETCRKLYEHRMRRKIIIPQHSTKIERKIEDELKKINIPFKNNEPILEARTIPDFVLPRKVLIYCDGDYWHNRSEIKEKDERQNKTLKALGYRVIRLWEHEINNDINFCVTKIKETYYASSRMVRGE